MKTPGHQTERIKIDIEPGMVFTPAGPGGGRRHSHRRVVAVFQDRVCYSAGGDKNHFCKVKTFQRWVRRAQRSDKR